MSATAALLTKLIDVGTPSALVAEVAVALAEAEADKRAIEQRRAKDRDRQSRARYAASRDVTLDDVTGRDITDDLSPSLSPPQTPPNTHPHTREEKPRARKGTRLPLDFEPQINGKTAEMIDRWPPGRLDREVAQFRDHYAKTGGEKGLSLDWQASLRTWLRNADDRIKPHHHNDSAPGLGRTGQAALVLLDRMGRSAGSG